MGRSRRKRRKHRHHYRIIIIIMADEEEKKEDKGEHINLKVKDQDNAEVHIKVRAQSSRRSSTRSCSANLFNPGRFDSCSTGRELERTSRRKSWTWRTATRWTS